MNTTKRSSKARPKRDYHHGALRQQLLDASIAIVAREGIDALSLRAVAKSAGVSHNAPYAHFADKDELVAAVKTYAFQTMALELERAISGMSPGVPMVRALADAYERFALEYPELFQVAFRRGVEPIAKEGEYVDLGRAVFARLEHAMESRPGKPALPARDAALLGWCMLHGMITLWTDGPLRHIVGTDAELRDLSGDLLPTMLRLLES